MLAILGMSLLRTSQERNVNTWVRKSSSPPSSSSIARQPASISGLINSSLTDILQCLLDDEDERIKNFSEKCKGKLTLGTLQRQWVKGKAIPLLSWRGPQGSRRLRLPDFKTIGT